MNGRWKGKRIGVLMGGVSKEREVSLRSGTAMASALSLRGYAVTTIDIGADMVAQVQRANIDVAVIALHGAYGEDGAIQGVLECLRIPYTSSGIVGSAVAMDKVLCKLVAGAIGISTPFHHVFHATTDTIEGLLAQDIAFPVVVKPTREGSTIGISIVKTAADLPQAIQLAAASDSKIVIEEFVAGTEVTVGWVSGQALTPLEIVPKSGFYDYHSKYTKGATEYIVPARIPAPTTAVLKDWTTRLCRELECRGMARADYIVRADGSAAFIELNTIPGMTETSLVPKAAAHDGMSFEAVCERVLDDATL